MQDPEKRRRNIRLAGYDYASGGAYFVTIVAQNKRPVFGHIIEDVMHPNQYGNLAQQCWLNLPQHFTHVILDEWIVMPNHFHGIIIFKATPASQNTPAVHNTPATNVGARHASPCNTTKSEPENSSKPERPSGTPAASLGAAIGSFKSAVTRQINSYRHQHQLAPVKVWQRNYYERIIRDEGELEAIRSYIIENPQRWTAGESNP